MEETNFGGSAIVTDTKVGIDPQQARELARAIERIAEDLRGAQQRFAPYAAPAATGRDEVSVTVARTAQRMADAQRSAAETAATDLARLGKSVGEHVDVVERRDGDLATSLRAEH